jgi:hypothetical protein
LPIVFAGRPSVGGVGLAVSQFGSLRAARFGALGSILPDSVLSDSVCLIQKARGGFSGAGLILATIKICR